MVVEGRDIGTVVAPAAPLKVFLTASSDARAHRRSRQDGTLDHRSTAVELSRRDAYDSSRQHSPLRAAEDAVHLDTTAMTVDQVIRQLVDMAAQRRIPTSQVAGRRQGRRAGPGPRRRPLTAAGACRRTVAAATDRVRGALAAPGPRRGPSPPRAPEDQQP